MKGDEKIDKSSGCWLEPDGRGKHCMCHTDYCNRLVDRREEKDRGPLAPLLPDAQFLKQNPLIDYDSPNFGDDNEDGAAPPPDNILFPAAVKADPVTSGDSDDDLTPIDFDEYDREITDKDNEQSAHRKSPTDISSAVPSLPSWVLMTLTMAASWARLLLSL
uniref:Activin_recp domain-containing protein n=1 Tax=Heterorhabditis bacteriophora TaxID=37862 RepID=A0A1I7XM74_HETBA